MKFRGTFNFTATFVFVFLMCSWTIQESCADDFVDHGMSSGPVSCTEDVHCTDGYKCDKNKCVEEVNSGPVSCTEDVHCADGYECRDYHCIQSPQY